MLGSSRWQEKCGNGVALAPGEEKLIQCEDEGGNLEAYGRWPEGVQTPVRSKQVYKGTSDSLENSETSADEVQQHNSRA